MKIANKKLNSIEIQNPLACDTLVANHREKIEFFDKKMAVQKLHSIFIHKLDQNMRMSKLLMLYSATKLSNLFLLRSTHRPTNDSLRCGRQMFEILSLSGRKRFEILNS